MFGVLVFQIVHRYDIILIQEVRDSDLSATKKLMEHVNKLDLLHTAHSAYTVLLHRIWCPKYGLLFGVWQTINSHYTVQRTIKWCSSSVCVCVSPEVLLHSGTVTSSVSLWVAAPIRSNISSSTGTQKANRDSAMIKLSFVENLCWDLTSVNRNRK